MWVYLRPHRLQGNRQLYLAALNCDSLKARECFVLWRENLDPGTLNYLEHKLVGIAAARHLATCERNKFDGILSNIQRQNNLRAHSAHHSLETLLTALKPIQFQALGETLEYLKKQSREALTLDHLELAVTEADFLNVVKVLPDLGYEPVSAIRSARLRAKFVGVFRHRTFPHQLRIQSLHGVQSTQTVNSHYENLVYPDYCFWTRFYQSRRSSLLARRDQILFDVCILNEELTDVEFSKLVSGLPLWPRKMVRSILGY